MNKLRFWVFGFAILLASVALCNNILTVSLTNTLPVQRVDGTVVLRRDSIEKKIGNLSNDLSILVKNEKGEVIASQLDDLNGDKNWEELAFIINFEPSETKKISLVTIPKNQVPDFPKRAHVHLGVSRLRNGKFIEVREEERPKNHVAQSVPFLYQYEGPGWENDKLAFRTYFDSRNGKDVFGKLIPEMVTDSIGLPGKSYHELAPWGMDVLKVGKSLGVGAIAITDGDSIYRLGETETAHFKVIADGPVRAIFQLSYFGWKVKGENLHFSEQITIWGGKNYFSSKASVFGTKNKNLSLVTGVTTLYLIDENYKPEFIKTENNYSFVSVNNVLSENKDFLAIGVMAKNDDLKYWKQAPESGINDEVIKTALMVLNSDSKTVVEYFIFAGWEKSDIRFKTEKMLNAIMLEEAARLNHKVIIKY